MRRLTSSFSGGISGLATISRNVRSASARLAATRSCSERAAIPASWSPDFSSLAFANSSRRLPNLKVPAIQCCLLCVIPGTPGERSSSSAQQAEPERRFGRQTSAHDHPATLWKRCGTQVVKSKMLLSFCLCCFFFIAQVADIIMGSKDALGLLLQHAADIRRQILFQGFFIGMLGAVFALLHAVQHGLIAQAKIGLGFKPQAV